jgi:sigma-B regulation protein RsbU (phosphoserine phosphatase)
MRRLNDVLLERRVDAHYVTLLLMMWNPRTRVFTVSNAGGLLPIVCRDAEKTKIKAEGVPLGLLEDREYDEVSFHARRGDVVVLYSDGIADQYNASEQEYGTTRLFKTVKRVCRDSPDQIVEAIFVDIDAFRQEMPLNDDQSLIIIKVR